MIICITVDSASFLQLLNNHQNSNKNIIKFLLKLLIPMKEKSEKGKTFIQNLFDNLIFKQGDQTCQIIDQTIGERKEQSFGFYEQLQVKFFSCKNQIKKLCSATPTCQEKTARKIVNTLMYLTKDVDFLLQEGILNLYMELVEAKQKTLHQQGGQKEMFLIEKCIQTISPLLFQFFSFRQYKKKQVQRKQAKKLMKTVSLSKKVSSQDQDVQKIPKSCSKRPFGVNLHEIELIQSKLSAKTLNELLEDYLNEYEMQIDDLEQMCKICSKKINISHLQQHVAYCQKKYIIKQDLKNMKNNIIDLAEELLLNRQKRQLQAQNMSNQTSQKAFAIVQQIKILQQIIRTHKNPSVKPQTVKKIQSQARVIDNLEQYKQLIVKLETFMDQTSFQAQFYHQIYIFLQMERKAENLLNQLKSIEIQQENLREIVSTSTIRPVSQTSNCKSDKKSRFAIEKKQQKNSNKNSNKNQSFELKRLSQKPDQQSQQIMNGQFVINFQSLSNFEEQNQNFQHVPLKTKQSLCNAKNVQFYVDKEINGLSENQDQQLAQSQHSNRKSRRTKSMIQLFQNDSQSQKGSEIQEGDNFMSVDVSQSTSKRVKEPGLKNFEILKFLGKGAFGKVYAVRRQNTQDLYALKLINIGQNWGPRQFQQIQNQHQIFKQVAGQHLVQAPFCFSEGGVHIFMMQFMPGGDLSKVLEEQVYLQEQRAVQVLAQIVLAIEHLHNAQIIHRDLKPQNLVIDDKGHLKLTDFGLSEIKIQNKMQKVKKITEQSSEQLKSRKKMRRAAIITSKEKVKLIGTPDYIAPQIINGISINNKSIDWWSLGVIAYEIMVGVRPFCGNSIQQILENILKFNIEWPQIGEEQGMISQAAFDLMQRLLDRDFVNRLGANGSEQIKNHVFFRGLDWDRVKYKNASIMPNYAKVKQLLQMAEDIELRKQIESKVGINYNIKIPKLDNFVRFDILGQKTVKQANQVKFKKTGTLRRLQSIKQFMSDKENSFDDDAFNKLMPASSAKKKTKSIVDLEKKNQIDYTMDYFE